MLHFSNSNNTTIYYTFAEMSAALEVVDRWVIARTDNDKVIDAK